MNGLTLFVTFVCNKSKRTLSSFTSTPPGKLFISIFLFIFSFSRSDKKLFSKNFYYKLYNQKYNVSIRDAPINQWKIFLTLANFLFLTTKKTIYLLPKVLWRHLCIQHIWTKQNRMNHTNTQTRGNKGKDRIKFHLNYIKWKQTTIIII